MVRRLLAKEAFKKTWAVIDKRSFQLFGSRLFDKTTVFDEAIPFETHCLWVLQQCETFSIFVHDEHLSIEGTETSRLDTTRTLD